MRAFLYAGQGSQRVGMGKDLYNAFPEFKSVIDGISLPFDIKALMFEGPADKLNDTRYTQPCYAAFAAAVTAVLLQNGITPDAACGLSLGEYGALYAAGVWNTKDYINLVAYRGQVMADAVRGLVYSMSAVLGTDAKAVEEACGKFGEAGFVTVANYNCPGQYVICGDEAAAMSVESYMKEAHGARCVRLNTTSPFHTKLLKPAGDALAERFGEVEFKKPQIPVAMNVTGRLLDDGDDVKVLLEQQVQKSVRFEDDIRTLFEAGVDEFIEIGPGNVLTGLCKKTARSIGIKIKSAAVQTADDLRGLIKAV